MKRWLLSGLPVTVGLAVLALAGVVISAYGSYSHIRARLNHTLNERILKTAEEVARVATETAALSPGPLWTDDEGRVLKETLRVIRRTSSLENVFLFDRGHRSLADARPRINMGKQYTFLHLSIDAIRQVIEEGQPFVDDQLSAATMRFHNATVPLVIDGDIIGGVYVQANARFDDDLVQLRRNWQLVATLSVIVSGVFLIILVVVFQQITRVNKELNKQSRLGVISLLSAGISHDIKNPLGSIMAASELLRRKVGEDEDNTQLLDFIMEGSNRILDITQTLLSGGDNDRRGAISLHDLVTALVKQLTPVSMEKKVTITIELTPGFVGWASMSAMRMALANIIKNAMEAVPPGEGTITITGRRDGKRIGVAISDNGPGIPPAMRKKIFDPLVTTKKTGSGIGLPVTRQVLEDMQGSLELETEPGQGSTFTLWVPEAKLDDGKDPDS